MNFLESLLHLDLPRPFVEACASGYTAIFEAKETKMEKAIKTACKIAGVKDEGDLSDGNHTFNSLYHQRCILFATLVNLFPSISWKTKKHKDVERLLSLLPENLPRSVLGNIWNKRGDCNMKNYQKPAPLVESQYNTYKTFPRNQVRATYSGHALHLPDGTVVDGFPIGIRGTVEVIVDGAEKGNFEYKPFRWPTDPEEPEPIYYQYKITTHIPEDSANKPANHVHFTNCPDAEKLVRWVSFSKAVPLVESVKYVKGHKNSKGEDAPWTIVSHETGKILSSHKTENEAKKHLQQMEYYKHKG